MRLSADVEAIIADAFGDARHQRLPDPTHHRRVLTGERIERAVSQSELARSRLEWLEPEFVEDGGGIAQQLRGTRLGGTASTRPKPDRPSRVAGPIQGGVDPWTRRRRLGEQAGKQLVVAARQAHSNRVTRTPVELRGAAGARPGLPGQAAVLGRQQPHPDQLVQVEGREGAADPERLGSLVTTHGLHPAPNELVQPTPIRLEEGRERFELRLDVWPFHQRIVGCLARSGGLAGFGIDRHRQWF